MNNNVSGKISAGLDSCKEINDSLSAFIDGELSKDLIIVICDHLIECEECKNNYIHLRKTQTAIRNYFNNSTEKSAYYLDFEKQNIVTKIIFAKIQKRLIYSIAILSLVALSFLSLNFLSIYNTSENKDEHVIKLVKTKKEIKDKTADSLQKLNK